MTDRLLAEEAIKTTKQWVSNQNVKCSLDEIVQLLCVQTGACKVINQQPMVMIVTYADGSGVGVHRKGLDLLSSIPVTTEPTSKEVSLTAYWGNDDASSTIALSQDKWMFIQFGGHHIEHAKSWYEGDSEDVIWTFSNRVVSIDGEDCRQCLVDAPICELYVDE